MMERIVLPSTSELSKTLHAAGSVLLHVEDLAVELQILLALFGELVTIGAVPRTHVLGGFELECVCLLKHVSHLLLELAAEVKIGFFFEAGRVELAAETGVFLLEVE